MLKQVQLTQDLIVLLKMQAEIASTDNGRYWLLSEDIINTAHAEYIHHPDVDGDNTYGTTATGFPRRCLVGAYMLPDCYAGSRSIHTLNSPAHGHTFHSI